ncbi:class I SAM-dependent methyltransferase [Paraclostridium bifermentans]|jgi:ubiquinone/menaquinone biosynthesis C-methylase UbiE|uniref:class I SAM-dependent methyltransferase n=1 Tax=Paraclostridium bifermentans TaxID=1490 RepID=UPI0011DD99E2|nr:class I SAM-dependent methyltransferase [Paraclostridium bifermentans]MDU3336484.1 methyltransferase domain-containing protein [Paraclostridium bifermentans]MDU3803858.1 methyltransferase domain-containing protein [Paraclostridium bifermentans]
MNQVEFFNQIAKEWDSIIEVNEEKINTLLSKLNITDNSKVLDIGTGTGVLIPFLKSLNPNGYIKGVDISSEMLNVAREKFRNIEKVSFELVDVEKDVINETYDSIVLYSMFPHLKDKTNTIKKLVEKNLEKSGQLIIAHSNSRTFLNNMHKEKNECVSEDRLISVTDQRYLFEKVGLKVVDAFEDNEIYYLVIKRC